MTSRDTASRIDSLDYLRGLSAFGVMMYHLFLKTYGEQDSSTILGKSKIFLVVTFFILSGLTLYKVNIGSFVISKDALRSFYIKRVFRIVPLLWLVTILTVVLAFGSDDYSLKKIIANITILPGAIKPETYTAQGAWSIGDELFFYMLFPFLLWMIKSKKILFYIVLILAFGSLCYFTFCKLNPAIPLGHQWPNYVNPLDNLFYFVSGIALGAIYDTNKRYQWLLFIIIVICLMIFFYPVTGEPIMLVTGYTRIILSGLVIILCFLFYKTDFSFLPEIIKSGLHLLGVISYSLYLLHPIVAFVLKDLAPGFFTDNPVVFISLSVVVALLVSYFSYTYFESYFIKKGKLYSAKFGPKQQNLKGQVW